MTSDTPLGVFQFFYILQYHLENKIKSTITRY